MLMSVREDRAVRGRRQGHEINRLIGREIRHRRRTAGISQASLAGAIGLSQAEIARIESGASPWLTIANAASILAVLGLRLWAKVYPAGPPLRDAGHLRLLSDFEARLDPRIDCRREWPIPGDAAGRAIDLLLIGLPSPIAVEAETLISDIQELERELNLKLANAGLRRMVLLVRGSRRNREVLRAAGSLSRAFPLSTRAVMHALSAGRDPGANGIVIL
jgi:transcriptional regulator with XRE-family HTH domain